MKWTSRCGNCADTEQTYPGTDEKIEKMMNHARDAGKVGTCRNRRADRKFGCAQRLFYRSGDCSDVQVDNDPVAIIDDHVISIECIHM